MGGQRPAFPRAREKLSFLSSQAPAAPCSSGWEGQAPLGTRQGVLIMGTFCAFAPGLGRVVGIIWELHL